MTIKTNKHLHMNKLLLLGMTVVGMLSYAQIKFEQASFINNNDEKVTCLIKNEDWRNSPVSFQYKLSENSPEKTAYLKDVKEFQFENSVKYIRETVKIDRSSNDLNQMNTDKKPDFKQETLFLKQLVSGPANLYKYKDGNLDRYFFNKNQDSIKQLVYKTYLIDTEGLDEKPTFKATNTEYKKQLADALVCAQMPTNFSEKADYTQSSLVRVFNDYNICVDPNYQAIENPTKKGQLHVAIRPRVNFTNSKIKNESGGPDPIEFGQKTGFSAGLELEYVFPFNKNKWSFTLEPSYVSYKDSKSYMTKTFIPKEEVATIDYKALEIAAGPRFYMFLSPDSKLFLNAQVVYSINGSSKIQFTRKDGSELSSLDIDNNIGLGFGLGYKFKDRFGAEVRAYPSKTLLGNYTYWQSTFSNLSLILSYNLF